MDVSGLKISIVTVVFNRVDMISAAMESVLRQTHPSVEYIVVDGGSSDGTVDKIREFEPKFNGRMRWISEKDHGIYDAMNKGIRMATGDVVAILNSDDFYHRTDTLSRVAAAFAEDPELEIVYGDNLYVDRNDLSYVVRYAAGSNYNRITARLGVMPPHATFFTYRRNFEQYGYYHEHYKIAADYELELRFLERFRLKSRYLPFSFMTMRIGGESTCGWRANWISLKECSMACRENDIYTNPVLQLLKLAIKFPQKFRRGPIAQFGE